MLALSKDSARQLSSMFEKRNIEKKYLAVARGYTHLHGCIDHPIGDRDKPDRLKVSATTYYRTLARLELPYRVDRYPTTRYSLLEIQPASGRRHQIRQHMKHINHPLIGDTSYGKTAHNRLFSQLYDSHRLLLHASALTFSHPVSNQITSICSRVTEKSIDQGQYMKVLLDERWQKTSAGTTSYWMF